MDSLFALPSSLLIIGGLALIFAFSNGFRDSSSIVATVVSTRALSTNKAFILSAVGEFVGAFLIGTAISKTISEGIFIDPSQVNPTLMAPALAIGLLSAIFWGVVSWWQAWPASNNQCLFAGVIGATSAGMGFDNLNLKLVVIVFVVLITSPLIGFLISFMLTSLIRYLGEWLTPKAKKVVQRFHIFSCFLVSCAHGSNDAQMIMGVLFIVLTVGVPADVSTAVSLRLLVACVLAMGVILGGKRILKKMGMQFYQIQSTQGLGAQLTSAGTLLTCAFSGFPASTTQVITGSIVGAGVAKNAKGVRWHVAQEIALSWIITVPTVFMIGYVLSLTFSKWMGG